VSLTLWIGVLVVPIAALLVDLGRRRLTALRLLRPLILTAVIVPFVMPGFDLRAAGLVLEAAAVVAGLLLGLLSASAMGVERDTADGGLVTVAGAPYAVIWIIFGAARLAFTYETEHSASFGRAVGEFLVSHHISVTALADAMMFIGLAMIVTNRCTLFLRGRRLPVTAASAAPAAKAAVAG
jgi:membrane protein CcdC involved in cytochrome C biogenesis